MENLFCQTEWLTNSTGRDLSMFLNSSLSSSGDKVDKWKSLMLTGISVNSPKSLRISGPDNSIESFNGVPLFSLQTAVGSTLGDNHHGLVKRESKVSPKFQQISNNVKFSILYTILKNCSTSTLSRPCGADLIG